MNPPPFSYFVHPPIEELVDLTDGRFQLVTLAARRARELRSYFAMELSPGVAPPLVASLARNPLSIALEEIYQERKKDTRKEIPE